VSRATRWLRPRYVAGRFQKRNRARLRGKRVDGAPFGVTFAQAGRTEPAELRRRLCAQDIPIALAKVTVPGKPELASKQIATRYLPNVNKRSTPADAVKERTEASRESAPAPGTCIADASIVFSLSGHGIWKTIVAGPRQQHRPFAADVLQLAGRHPSFVSTLRQSPSDAQSIGRRGRRSDGDEPRDRVLIERTQGWLRTVQ
jgi:hypothetical protein